MSSQSPSADRVSLGPFLALLAALLLSGGIHAAPPAISFEETSLTIDAKSGLFQFRV